MARSNNHPERKKLTVRILHADGTFSHWISPADRDRMLPIGKLVAVYETRNGQPNHIGWTHEVAFKDSSKQSPACITHSDMEAVIGLSRFRNGDVSDGRIKSAQAKVKEFGKNPAWMYRVGVTVVDRLPEMPLAAF